MKKNIFLVGFILIASYLLYVFFFADLDKPVKTKKLSHQELIIRIRQEAGLRISNKFKIHHFKEDNVSGWNPIWIAKLKIPVELKSDIIAQIRNREAVNVTSGDSLTGTWWVPQKIIIQKWYKQGFEGATFILISEEDNGDYLYIKCFT